MSRNLKILKFLGFPDFLFALPFLVIFQMREVGLTLTQVLSGEAVFAATVFLFEIPSSIFGDKFSRQKSLIFGEIFYFFAAIFFAFAQNFSHILLAQILFGIAIAAISGCDRALLFETLKNENREKNFQKISNQFLRFFLISMAAGNLASGFLLPIFGMRFLFFTTIPIVAAKLIAAFFLREPQFERSNSNSLKFLRQSFEFIFSHRAIWGIIFASVFVFFARKIEIHTQNPFFEIANLPLEFFGVAGTILFLTAAGFLKILESVSVNRGLKPAAHSGISFVAIFVLQAAGFFLAAKFVGVFAFLFFAISRFAFNFGDIFFADFLHQKTPSKIRATIDSISGFFRQIFQFLFLPLFGFFAEKFGLLEIYCALAGILIFIGISGRVFLRREF